MRFYRLRCFVALFLFFVFVSHLQASEDFFLLDDRAEKSYQTPLCAEDRVSPCSTFKIFLSLVGFDAGFLQNEEAPKWPYKEGYTDFLDTWRQEQTPKSWMRLSCVWYSQVLAKEIGLESMQSYLEAMQYGNQDMSGGLCSAWLNSSLKISLKEQVYFLQKLVRKTLPVSDYALDMTKRLLFLEEMEGGWKLFGKTGASLDENKKLGWFIGFIEKKKQVYIFAYRIQEKNLDLAQRIPRTKKLLKELGVFDE